MARKARLRHNLLEIDAGMEREFGVALPLAAMHAVQLMQKLRESSVVPPEQVIPNTVNTMLRLALFFYYKTQTDSNVRQNLRSSHLPNIWSIMAELLDGDYDRIALQLWELVEAHSALSGKSHDSLIRETEQQAFLNTLLFNSTFSERGLRLHNSGKGNNPPMPIAEARRELLYLKENMFLGIRDYEPIMILLPFVNKLVYYTSGDLGVSACLKEEGFDGDELLNKLVSGFLSGMHSKTPASAAFAMSRAACLPVYSPEYKSAADTYWLEISGLTNRAEGLGPDEMLEEIIGLVSHLTGAVEYEAIMALKSIKIDLDGDPGDVLKALKACHQKSDRKIIGNRLYAPRQIHTLANVDLIYRCGQKVTCSAKLSKSGDYLVLEPKGKAGAYYIFDGHLADKEAISVRSEDFIRVVHSENNNKIVQDYLES